MYMALITIINYMIWINNIHLRAINLVIYSINWLGTAYIKYKDGNKASNVRHMMLNDLADIQTVNLEY